MMNLFTAFETITSKAASSITTLHSDICNYQQKSSQSRKTNISGQQIKSEKLNHKKKELLRELDHVNRQIIKNKTIQHQNNQKRANSAFDEEQAYNKAAQLISRMNSYRKQLSLRRQEQQMKIQRQVQQSKKKLKELDMAHEMEIKKKREQIKSKINARRENMMKINQYNRQADQLITEIQEYRVSLPSINSFENPGNSELKTPEKSSVKVGGYRKYRKSPFLQTLQKQQLAKRQQQRIRSWQKKRVRDKHKQYGRQIQSRIRDIHIFVT